MALHVVRVVRACKRFGQPVVAISGRGSATHRRRTASAPIALLRTDSAWGLHLDTETKWSSCARRTGGPPNLRLWLWALRAAASLPCCDLQTSKTWIRNNARGSHRRASATSPRSSLVRARGRRSKRSSVCASATTCGCTAGDDDDGSASTRSLCQQVPWPRGPHQRRRSVQRPRPARRRRVRVPNPRRRAFRRASRRRASLRRARA